MSNSRDESPLEEKHAPVVELALLRVLHPFTPTHPSVVTNLRHAREILETHSQGSIEPSERSPFYVYVQIEDSSCVYLIGTWRTIAEHKDFLSSDANKKLLNRLQGQVKVEWMFHVDVPLHTIPLEAPVLSFTRGTMARRDVQAYCETFSDVQGHLDLYVAPHRWTQGRRIDFEAMDDGRGNMVEVKHLVEYLLFCGGENLEPREPGKMWAFEQFRAVGAYLLESNVRHARRLELVM